MPEPPPSILFLPANVAVSARKGETLLDVALDHGIELPHECGGNCSCTTCHVVIEEGWENLSPIEYPEDERMDDAESRTARSRLACQALALRGFVTVRLAEEVVDARRI
jgi:2Fe-2S ferredoxin